MTAKIRYTPPATVVPSVPRREPFDNSNWPIGKLPGPDGTTKYVVASRCPKCEIVRPVTDKICPDCGSPFVRIGVGDLASLCDDFLGAAAVYGARRFCRLCYTTFSEDDDNQGQPGTCPNCGDDGANVMPLSSENVQQLLNHLSSLLQTNQELAAGLAERLTKKPTPSVVGKSTTLRARRSIRIREDDHGQGDEAGQT